jgi:hypothetical protein
MAKMTKNMLKGIVKECLVELLAEGLGQAEVPLLESRRPARANRQSQNKKRNTIFDQIDQTFAGQEPKTGFNEAIAQAARTASADPMMQAILTDTAKTTLQEQLRHEPRSANAGPQFLEDNETALAQAPGAGLDITSLFGEATNNWSEVLDRADAKKLP